MSFPNDTTTTLNPAGLVSQAQYDMGLRQYMLRIYNLMALGVGLTGLVALAVAFSPLAEVIYGTPLKWVAAFAPLGFIFFLSFKFQTMSLSTLQTTFWAFCAVMGVSMGSIFLMYPATEIIRVFFITSASFAGLSLFGYTTKRSLTGMGSFLIMGVWGLIIASIANIFFESSALAFTISVAGVLIFAGLTAYDTQRLKDEYSSQYGVEAVGKMAVMGALTLYLDFINLFQMLLSLLANRRE